MAKPKILLIEPNSQDLKLIESILKSYGTEVLIASEGTVGYNMAVQKPFDLFLIENDLPDTDGLSVIKKLKKLTRTKIVPVEANLHSWSR